MSDLTNLLAELSREKPPAPNHVTQPPHVTPQSHVPFFTQKDPLKIASFPDALKYTVHTLCRQPDFLTEVKKLLTEQQRRISQLEREYNEIAVKVASQARDFEKVDNILLSVGIGELTKKKPASREELEAQFYESAHVMLTNMYDYIYKRLEQLHVPLFYIGPEAKARGGKEVREGQRRLVEVLETLVSD